MNKRFIFRNSGDKPPFEVSARRAGDDYQISKFGLYILFLALSLMVVSCGSAYYNDCISPKMQGLEISWGDHTIATGKIDGYVLHTNGDIMKLTRDSSGVDYKKVKIGNIDEDKYCEIYKQATIAVMKTQTLNSAVDIERFVQYRNSSTLMNFRGSWNPKYETVGSKEFREVYDSLQELIKTLD